LLELEKKIIFVYIGILDYSKIIFKTIEMSIVEMKVPTIGESIKEVTLSTWLKKDGDFVNIDEAICEFESDKATLEFPAEASGKLIYVAAEGDDLAIGALVAKIDTSVAAPTSSTPSASPPVAATVNTSEQAIPRTNDKTSYATGHPSPAAAKILAEKSIDPASVTGTGVDGRITKEDAQKAQPTAPKSAKAATTPSPIIDTSSFSRASRREKMSRMRRTIAARLVEAKNETAMLTTFNELDMTGILELRKTYQESFVAKYGIKLGFMSLFAKACAQALIEMPQVNAIIDDNDLIYHDYADISIAISTDNGLVVPPVYNVESLGFHEVEYKIKELADKARKGTLSLDEMKGGTFTITNGGVFGSLMSTPIINRPQSAILGMHSIKERPIVVNGEIKIRPMMYLALSYDHRVIDGSSSVTFLVRVIELLEDPMRLMMKL
jgi:2-oxoglutarate dehydrogenase E2 component (dihydrolipoamide succinyltransferase)